MSTYDRRRQARHETQVSDGPCPGCGRRVEVRQDLLLVSVPGLPPIWWHTDCRAGLLAGTRPYRGQPREEPT
jgi:hypothetical protein